METLDRSFRLHSAAIFGPFFLKVTHGTRVGVIHLHELAHEAENGAPDHEPRGGVEPGVQPKANEEEHNDGSRQLCPLGHAVVESHWLRLGEILQRDLFAAPMNSGPCESVNNLGGAPPKGKQSVHIEREKGDTSAAYLSLSGQRLRIRNLALVLREEQGQLSAVLLVKAGQHS